MKRWGLAGVALAVVVLLVLVAQIGRSTGQADSAEDGRAESAVAASGAASATAGSDRRRRAGPRQVAVIQLPTMRAQDPQPLQLTRAVLEQAWLDGNLEVRLPDGDRYVVALESEQVDPGGLWTVVGRVQTRLGAQAMVMTVGPEAVFGVLPQPDGSLLQVTTTRGRTGIVAAGGLLPPGSKRSLASDPDYLLPDVGRARNVASDSTRVLDAVRTKSSSIIHIVVLGLYTSDLVELRGSISAAETEVTNLFATANQSHIDSGTRVRLVLAALRQIDIDPSMDNSQVLYAVTDDTVAGVDLARLRDQMAADLLAVVRPYRDAHGSCGIAWLNGAGRAPQYVSDRYGVSVSNVAPCGPHVLAHEIGHNMGSAHDRETQSINGYLEFGAFQYSFGHRQNGPSAFATIMAYSHGEPWLGYFSNPDSTVCGAQCGVENRADNVRSFDAFAPVVAAFRGPPGTLSIEDAEAYEPDPGSRSVLLFRVRLSGPAPVGGVQFDAVVYGGTAREGTDYSVGTTNVGIVIPEGDREANVVFEIIGDDAREPDETILLRLANVVGAAVHDGEAVGRILNDDPRPTVSGRILFDHGVPVPQSPFWMTVSGASNGYESVEVALSPPDFAYEVPLVKGSSLTFSIRPPPPFAILPFTIDEIESSRVHDIPLRKGLRISGAVKLPDGQPALTAPLTLDIRASIDGVYQYQPYPQLEPPDFRYTHWVVPGAWLYMEVVPPAPYERFFAVHSYVDSDLVQDIALSTRPSLVIWGGGKYRESPYGTSISLQLVIQLSAPAPTGGVRLRYRTVAGTATAGSDYTHIDGIMEIPEGATFGYTDTIECFSDSEPEGDEEFHVVLSEITGANPVVTRARVVLQDAPTLRQMSTPLPPRRKR
ncbi:reprolysin-like metallopeptidase [Luteimonas saliphila]|uniref:reprolysin-like metallopeptidase n=1 Tax=Luteimonas saliphila TaxID=2804919 RepID=UPI00192DA268|nr:M12 family metallo-peptidase [Luteimonas saliphila]